MLKKKISLILLLLLFSNCDYSPVYVKDKNFNFDFKIIETKGDDEINKHIIKNLKQQATNNSLNIFDIKMNTNFTKRVLARDSRGSSTDYELKAKSSFIILYNKIQQNLSIEEKLNYKKLSNNYEQNNYEKTIKKNISSSIARKLILRLTILND